MGDVVIDLFGVRIQEDPYLPEGSCVVIGHFDKPADWDTKTESEQMAYAVAHGALVMVKSLAAFRARAVGEPAPSLHEPHPEGMQTQTTERPPDHAG